MTRPSVPDVRAAAHAYLARGWLPIPVPYRTKSPGIRRWQELRLTSDDIDARFNGRPQNLGILLGEPSGFLIDIDLDHHLAVELAPDFLPPTATKFGRASKPQSHWIYRCASEIETQKFKSKTEGMVVELRSTGTQTVFPPSTHESGQEICWEVENVEPATVDPEQILDCLQRLFDAVKVRIGEAPKAPKKPQKRALREPSSGGSAAGIRRELPVDERERLCLAAMSRMEVADQNDGSFRLFSCACRVVEYDLDDAAAIEVIRKYAAENPFPNEWTDAEILLRIRDAELRCQRGAEIAALERPTILIGPDEYKVIDAAVTALAVDPTLYQRGNFLVRVLRDHRGTLAGVRRKPGAPIITVVPPPNLRERITRFARLIQGSRSDRDEATSAHPPGWLVAGVQSRGDWPGFRHLQAVSDIPVLRPDGTIWQTPGYDLQTGVLFDPRHDFPQIRDNLTRADAEAAVASLLEVVCDYSFATPAHRAAWLAALLTPFSRPAFEGPSPLFLVDANVRGAGKTLLVQTIGHIVHGREMPVGGYAHESAEMQKRITSIALAGDSTVLLDNIDGEFGNDALDRALTGTRWQDRVLGKNAQVDVPLLTTWYATGNNVLIAADTTRRLIHVRLDVLCERPEERGGFRHPDLIAWVREGRDKMVANALTVLAAFCRAGKPSQGLTPFGGFEGWSNLVRATIVWVGLPDPCLTRMQIAETADSSGSALLQLVRAWRQIDPDCRGFVIAELVRALYPMNEVLPSDEASIAMRAALENLVNSKPDEQPNVRSIGNRLKALRRRVADGSYIDDVDGAETRNGALWRLFPASPDC